METGEWVPFAKLQARAWNTFDTVTHDQDNDMK
jgi:hypothetical protein